MASQKQIMPNVLMIVCVLGSVKIDSIPYKTPPYHSQSNGIGYTNGTEVTFPASG